MLHQVAFLSSWQGFVLAFSWLAIFGIGLLEVLMSPRDREEVVASLAIAALAVFLGVALGAVMTALPAVLASSDLQRGVSGSGDTAKLDYFLGLIGIYVVYGAVALTIVATALTALWVAILAVLRIFARVLSSSAGRYALIVVIAAVGSAVLVAAVSRSPIPASLPWPWFAVPGGALVFGLGWLVATVGYRWDRDSERPVNLHPVVACIFSVFLPLAFLVAHAINRPSSRDRRFHAGLGLAVSTGILISVAGELAFMAGLGMLTVGIGDVLSAAAWTAQNLPAAVIHGIGAIAAIPGNLPSTLGDAAGALAELRHHYPHAIAALSSGQTIFILGVLMSLFYVAAMLVFLAGRFPSRGATTARFLAVLLPLWLFVGLAVLAGSNPNLATDIGSLGGGWQAATRSSIFVFYCYYAFAVATLVTAGASVVYAALLGIVTAIGRRASADRSRLIAVLALDVALTVLAAGCVLATGLQNTLPWASSSVLVGLLLMFLGWVAVAVIMEEEQYRSPHPIHVGMPLGVASLVALPFVPMLLHQFNGLPMTEARRRWALAGIAIACAAAVGVAGEWCIAAGLVPLIEATLTIKAWVWAWVLMVLVLGLVAGGLYQYFSECEEATGAGLIIVGGLLGFAGLFGLTALAVADVPLAASWLTVAAVLLGGVPMFLWGLAGVAWDTDKKSAIGPLVAGVIGIASVFGIVALVIQVRINWPSPFWVLPPSSVALALVLGLLANAIKRSIYSGGNAIDHSGEWRIVGSMSKYRDATVREVHNHVHGAGSWEKSANGTVMFFRVTFFLLAAAGPVALLAWTDLQSTNVVLATLQRDLRAMTELSIGLLVGVVAVLGGLTSIVCAAASD